MSTGLTRSLAELSSALEYEQLPDDVVEIARHCLLDWFGVTLGAADEPATAILLLALRSAEGPATVVGHGNGYQALDAALINGTASHALDFDDVSVAFLGHASVAILPAALALAEQLDATARELIAAFVAGYETVCRVARALGPRPYVRGFHQTGTIGTIGAAAACAHLLELDADATATAFGLASTQAAGLKCHFGTMAKPLHAGKACQNGLLAALLAADGFTANPDAIEADQGLAALLGGGTDLDAALADPRGRWHVRDNLFKYHASCFWTHSMLEGIGDLVRSGAVQADRIDHVEVHVSAIELGAAAIAEPTTALEVKYSLTHLAAMALLKRPTSVIRDEDAHDPELIALRAKITLVGDAPPGPPTRVEVLQDGRTYTAQHEVAIPDRDLAAQQQRLTDKFASLAVPALDNILAWDLLTTIVHLGPEHRVRELMMLARP
ncbi:MmgE/PrpD family protein [Nocardia pseudovaccinii]|uniref:MmgE/PrpD family protein n=1 Tax=Nocardia pseudovaccinii TaxID=189540 RepID=UPI0007A3861D|nr:MmgE/PrpD family protein [Nocardia pseudovaccinii]